MAFNEHNKWVIIEVTEGDDGVVDFFFAPEKLELPAGWIGNIIWHLFTPGWEFRETDGVAFPHGCGFDGAPQPDPTRARCWSTPAANDGTGTFNYTVNIHRLIDPSTTFSYADPVVENDPPTPAPTPADEELQEPRPTPLRREGSRRQTI